MREYDFFKDFKIQQGQFSLNTYSKADKFQIYAVKFIAELLLDDDYLLLSKFVVYKEFVANLFEFNIGDDVELREFLLSSLLHGSKEDNIVSKLISSANIEQITTETKNLLVEYSIKALESSIIIAPAYITSIDRLILEFGLARSKYSKQLDHIDSTKEKRVVDKNFSLFKGLGQNEFLQVDNRPITFNTEDTKKPKLDVKSFLPINNRKAKNTTDFSLKTTQSAENEKTRKIIARLIELNCMINSIELSKELNNIGLQLKDDTNRIVIVGEIKHGKSSLFNKILGQPLSPVGESTATTAAVIELFYSNKPKYEIKWMSSDGISKIMNYINDNENNPHLSEYRYNFEDLVNKDYFKPDEIFKGVRSKSDLPKYMCSSGEFVSAVER